MYVTGPVCSTPAAGDFSVSLVQHDDIGVDLLQSDSASPLQPVGSPAHVASSGASAALGSPVVCRESEVGHGHGIPLHPLDLRVPVPANEALMNRGGQPVPELDAVRLTQNQVLTQVL